LVDIARIPEEMQTFLTEEPRGMQETRLTFDIGEKRIELIPVTAREYANLFEQARPIQTNVWEQFQLLWRLSRTTPPFDLPRQYAALRTLFGESTTMYDDFKCSFGYPFKFEVSHVDRDVTYTILLHDRKGGLDLKFNRVISATDSVDSRELQAYMPPIADEFSQKEISELTERFISYLKDYADQIESRFDTPFIRSNDAALVIYGFRDGTFFTDTYEEDVDAFDAACIQARDSGVPFNRTAPN
jgi:hypothetical protein